MLQKRPQKVSESLHETRKAFRTDRIVTESHLVGVPAAQSRPGAACEKNIGSLQQVARKDIAERCPAS